MKSKNENLFSLTCHKADFIACAYRLRYIASFGVSARRIANFIHECGFIPLKADLTEKDSELYPILSLFMRKSSKKVCKCR